ncbi:hypothetical protein UlMin_037270 [Ulmus minor]
MFAEPKCLNESGKLQDKIDGLINEATSSEAPLLPLSGEDDLSSSGAIDELALVVKKMKESIVVNDQFYKMCKFTNFFLGSEAMDFLSEDQYLEREEVTTKFWRKLASKPFFQHILGENLLEDGNHFYRFLDNDPFVSKCLNIPRGIIEAKPKPIIEISSRLRFFSYAIFEAYASEGGKHVDYLSIHGNEEFAIEELQRVEVQEMSREEKLVFFINLYNMMVIHAILVWGYPAGALKRRRLLGDFRYVVGGSTYSLFGHSKWNFMGKPTSTIQFHEAICCKRETLIGKMVALPYPEPLIHFALVSGNIDKEFMEVASNFLGNGGVIIDFEAKNELEVMKRISNYLEPTVSEALLELLSNSQLKVTY